MGQSILQSSYLHFTSPQQVMLDFIIIITITTIITIAAIINIGIITIITITIIAIKIEYHGVSISQLMVHIIMSPYHITIYGHIMVVSRYMMIVTRER